MLDTLDLWIEEVKKSTNIDSEVCELESDFKPSDIKDRNEYAVYLIRDGEIYKQVIAELSYVKMKQFVKATNFPRHLHQCLDKLAVKAGYRPSIMNNDKKDKEVSDE